VARSGGHRQPLKLNRTEADCSRPPENRGRLSLRMPVECRLRRLSRNHDAVAPSCARRSHPSLSLHGREIVFQSTFMLASIRRSFFRERQTDFEQQNADQHTWHARDVEPIRAFGCRASSSAPRPCLRLRNSQDDSLELPHRIAVLQKSRHGYSSARSATAPRVPHML
jgi:hypothetical protein